MDRKVAFRKTFTRGILKIGSELAHYLAQGREDKG